MFNVSEEAGQDRFTNELIIQVHPLIKGAVQLPPPAIRCLAVQLLRIVEQIEGRAQQLGSQRQLHIGFSHLLPESFSVLLHPRQAGSDLDSREGAIGSQVEEPFFSVIELGQLHGQVRLQVLGGFVLVGEQVAQLTTNTHFEVLGQRQPAVLPDDLGLHPVDSQVRQVAEAVLSTSADIVGPAVTAAPPSQGVDDPGLTPGHVAALAEEQTFQVVIVLALPGSSCRPQVKDLLDPVEQLRTDKGGVSAGVLRAVVLDDALVVRVMQHLLELGQGDRPPGAITGRPSGKTSVDHGLEQAIQGVVARGIQLEHLPAKRSPFLIESNGAYFVTIKLESHVLVPEWRPPECPAILGLLAHLVADVSTIFSGAKLVERGQDAVHELANWCLVNVLGGRDQGDLMSAQQHQDLGVVDAVAVQSREFVHDHVVDVSLGADAIEHLLKDWSFFDVGSGASGFHKLTDDLNPHLLGFAFTRHALSRDGDTFRVIVSVHLARRAHP